MPITTEVVSSNPVHGEVYSIHHYVIMFVSDVRWVFSGTLVSFTNKTDLNDIAEILLKVALNTITQFHLCNITNVVPMTTSVSRWLHIVCIMCKIMAFYIARPVLCECYHLPHMRKHLRDRIISKRRDVWGHKKYLTPPFFYWSACMKPGKWASCVCVLGVSILPFSTYLRFYFGIIPTVWYFFCFSIYFILLLNVKLNAIRFIQIQAYWFSYFKCLTLSLTSDILVQFNLFALDYIICVS